LNWRRHNCLYVGYRDAKGYVHVEADTRQLPLRLDLDNHSPDGFEWGYGGSGPAQLALALLAHATGDDEFAREYHQRFKFSYVASLPQDENWRIFAKEVRERAKALKTDERAQSDRA
jgi:uncharacterized protein (DUF2249 family)